MTRPGAGSPSRCCRRASNAGRVCRRSAVSAQAGPQVPGADGDHQDANQAADQRIGQMRLDTGTGIGTPARPPAPSATPTGQSGATAPGAHDLHGNRSPTHSTFGCCTSRAGPDPGPQPAAASGLPGRCRPANSGTWSRTRMSGDVPCSAPEAEVDNQFRSKLLVRWRRPAPVTDCGPALGPTPRGALARSGSRGGRGAPGVAPGTQSCAVAAAAMAQCVEA
jgi:hypothetical protein